MGGPSAATVQAACRGSAPSQGRFLIQWSVIIIPRATSRRGIWQPMQPVCGEVGQGVFGGPEWHLRQTAS